MELKDTISMMQSDNYKERLKAEYFQTRIRWGKLANMIEQYRSNTLPFKPVCIIDVYKKQDKAMRDYLDILKYRAEAEGINLFEEE